METTALETAEANLNAAEQAAGGGQGQEQTQEKSANDQETQAAATTDPYGERFSKLEQALNRISSELGGTRKLQSEFDKFRQAQTQQTQTAPKSWDELDEPSKKTTQEILDHWFRENYGKKLEAYEAMHSSWQEQQQARQVENIARQELGADFDKFNPVMYEIVESIKALAETGREDAQKFLTELKSTESGVHRLIGMARAQLAQSVEAKNQKVTQDQEQKAKRAAVQVGGTKTAPSTVDAQGLPKKGSEGRLEAMESLLDKLESQKQR
jgi:hypothetical protein